MKTMPIYIIMSLMGAMPQTSLAQDNCLLMPSKAICQTEMINLYVGPQSVEPGEDIFIAIETMTGSLESSPAEFVTIIDENSGQRYQVKVDQGLGYIEIKAPARAGRLVFSAKTGPVSSDTAEVLVHAGKAESFELMIEKNKGELFLSSSIITDGFGNILDDGMSVDIDLIADTAVYSSIQTQTQNGRIGVHIGCETFRFANSRLRAKIGQVTTDIEIPNYICGAA